MSNKKQLSRHIDVLERQRFLDVYNEFDKWLIQIGHRHAKIKEATMSDSNIITNSVATLYGVEHYIIDCLNLHLYFVRERNNHVFYFVSDWNLHSAPHTLDEFKAQIVKDIKMLRDEKKKQLDALLTL